MTHKQAVWVPDIENFFEKFASSDPSGGSSGMPWRRQWKKSIFQL